MALLDELLVGLGFEYDPKGLEKFKGDVSKTTGVIKKLTRAAIVGAAAITGFTIASTRASDEQGKLADEIGDSVENLDALQFALERSGGSANGMASSLRNLSIRAAEATRGVGSGVEAFGLLGISTSDANGNLKRSSDLILEISKEFRGLSRSKQIELADKLGLSDSIRLLQQGPKAIRELTDEAKELGVTTSKDAVAAAEFQDSLTNVWKIAKQLSRIIVRSLSPSLKKINDGFIDWWKVNRSLIEQNIPIWIDKATTAVKLLTIASGIWIAMSLATHIVTLVTALRALSVAALLANAAVLAIPTLIAIAAAAIALLINDIITFINGGESFIGDLVEKFPLLGDVINAIAAVLEFLGEVFGKVWQSILSDVDTIIKAFKFLGEVFSNIWDNIVNALSNFKLPESLTKAIDFVKNLSFDGAVEATGNFISSLNPFSSDEPQLAPNLGDTTSNRSTTSIDKFEINVDGSGDPKAVANEVFNIFQQTSQDLNTAVDY